METPDRKPGRSKRAAPADESSGWDCTVCTFTNKPEAFKCDMCDTRKGTSTRKPKTNQQQAIIHQASIQLVQREKRKQRFKRPARLKNIDRSTAQHLVVTVGDVTVIITDYQPKAESTASASNTVCNYNHDSNMSFHESSETESE